MTHLLQIKHDLLSLIRDFFDDKISEVIRIHQNSSEFQFFSSLGPFVECLDTVGHKCPARAMAWSPRRGPVERGGPRQETVALGATASAGIMFFLTIYLYIYILRKVAAFQICITSDNILCLAMSFHLI